MRSRESAPRPAPPKFSDELEQWFRSEGPTLGTLIELLGPRSFAALFIVLMAVPALPLPTGGVTHVFEAIAMLIALQLIVGRREIWLPERWRRIDPTGSATGRRFSEALLGRIRWLEAHSRRRGARLLETRVARSAYGLIVFALCLTAFVAPPFSGLDTVPSLGVVVLSAGVMLGDVVLAFAGLVLGAAGVLVVALLGDLVVRVVGDLF